MGENHGRVRGGEKNAMKRYLEAQIRQDLRRKMVFLGGPRQVGKTTVAMHLLKDRHGYLNWDIPEDREAIVRREIPAGPLIVFDEIHKFRNWRVYLKGLYDRDSRSRKILVTGSARLDYYRFGGDSLQGRYHYLRLFPLSARELKMKSSADLDLLMRLGGFPEPFLGGSETQARRWSREYRSRLVREDVMVLEPLHHISLLEQLMIRLPDLVASPLSINSLREDLQVSHKTVSSWLDILERFYAIFRLPPFGAPRIRAVKKEQKHYHFDWTLVSDPSGRYENLIALHLLKYCAFRQDVEGLDTELRYFRDVDGREVDFVVVTDGHPEMFVECKLSDMEVSKGLKYLNARFPKVPAYQVSLQGQKDFETPEGIRVCPAITLLNQLV